jgi:transcriptional regulator with XRE-family HTH domain
MRLAELRRAAGLTQAELGRLTADKNSTTVNHHPRIYSYETGARRVSLVTAKRIVRVLNRHLKKNNSKMVAKLEDLIPSE